MSEPREDASGQVEETDSDRRRGILADGALCLDLVSALAGDRALSHTEEKRLDALRIDRGPRFYSDLLYSVTHQCCAPELADDLWRGILRHKEELASSLKRNVGIVVAALDYLSNVTRNMYSATLVGEAHIEEIVALSLRDGLTGLFNHTYFYQQIDFELRRYARYGTLVSLVLIDIDDFKAVNDVHGHREGDRILAAMGRTLLQEARDSDICCRYGGEELAVILPLTEIDEARGIAERLRASLTERLPDGSAVTVSIGVATCGKKIGTGERLVELAHAALYRAKRNGKNRVWVAGDGPASPDDPNRPEHPAC
jgi:diguanylate cyclase (GGDEF)-like protein